MGSVTLVLGGARSGKSRKAQQLIEAGGLQPIYIATAQPHDDEMRERIIAHQRERGPRWTTIEAPIHLSSTLQATALPANAILIDCLTLWLSNLMEASRNISEETEVLVKTLSDLPSPVICVSNEVGLGIVPDNALARRFRDEQGRLNQIIAGHAEKVIFMAAGLALQLKPQVIPSSFHEAAA